MKLLINTKEKQYPIYIGKNNCYNIVKILSENNIKSKNVIIIYDKNIPKKIIFKIKRRIGNINISFHKFIFNEKNKSMRTVEKILYLLQKNNFNRNDSLISIGGGIAGDICGFAASIFKRGICYINVPSTLLSQVDSSIGGKTGVNTILGKNMLGTFYQPDLVISDSIFLRSLPKREIICGYSEILKHSLISDRNFFIYLKKNYRKIISLEQSYLSKTVFKSCKIKKKIVEKDEKEKHIRKTLNFGHTFAHAFEAAMGFSKKLNHGEAVMLGMFAATKFSYEQGFLPNKDFFLIKDHLKKLKYINIKNYFKKDKIDKILSFMIKDKKNRGKKINLILLKGISKPLINNEYNVLTIKKFINKLVN